MAHSVKEQIPRNYLDTEITALEKEIEGRRIQLDYLRKKFETVAGKAGTLRLARRVLFENQ